MKRKSATMRSTTVNRYEIKNEIGKGGMATVFKAYDPFFERDVAIKLLPKEFLHDSQFRGRFQLEAKAIASLEHPAIVPVYDYGEANRQLFIVMRLMTGGSLTEKIQKGPMSLTSIGEIFQKLAPALDSAHSKGFVHRDIKPANILFDQWQNPYIADFGITKLIAGNSTALTVTGGLLGTPAYMSPEQVQGVVELDGRSDIYAMGVVFYQMLAGQLPYHAQTPIGLAFMHVNEPVPQLESAMQSLPTGCQALIDCVLAKDRQKRPSTLSAFAAAISLLAQSDRGQNTIIDTEALQTILDPLPGKLDSVTFEKNQLAAEEKQIFETVNATEDVKAHVAPLAQTNPGRKRKIGWGKKNRQLWTYITLIGVIVTLIGGYLLREKGRSDSNLVQNTSPAMIADTASKVEPSNTPVKTLEADPTVTKMIAVVEFAEVPTASMTPAPSTATLTPSPTMTATSLPTEIHTPVPVLVSQIRINSSSANLRDGPGINYNVLAVMYQDDIAEAIAVDSTGSWLNVDLPDNSSGWISTSAVSFENDITLEQIAVAATVPALPTASTSSNASTTSDWIADCIQIDDASPLLTPSRGTTLYGKSPVIFAWPSCDVPSGFSYRLFIFFKNWDDSFAIGFDTQLNTHTVSLPENSGAWEWYVTVIAPDGNAATYVDEFGRTQEINIPESSGGYIYWKPSPVGFFYDPFTSGP